MLDNITNNLIAFRDARNWKQYHTPENLAKSISIEAAELLECYQWGDGWKPRSNIEDEAADVAIYLLLFCEATGIDLEVSIAAKIRANGEKYPVGDHA